MKVLVLPVTAFQQNCTVVRCERTGAAAVIDPGGEVERLLAVVAKHDLRIEKILLTHGHLDHVGGAAELRERLGVPIWGPHRADAFWLEGLAAQAALFGMAAVRAFCPDRWLVGGERVAVGAMEFEVLHCPGHTPGHLVFFNRAANWAQVGDVIFAGSIGRTDFPRGDRRQLEESIRGKLFPLGDGVRFVPGHGAQSTFGRERRANPFVADGRYG
ncbi:MAG: MBL fold metallo-hydrolase [Cellvibrionales bacterium]|nr:MBL fold metallo-hydrolase [Cellvibrionales bacterium]